MFRCQNCGEVQKSGAKQYTWTLETRTRPDGSKEIAKEAKVCKKCLQALEETYKEGGDKE